MLQNADMLGRRLHTTATWRFRKSSSVLLLVRVESGSLVHACELARRAVGSLPRILMHAVGLGFGAGILCFQAGQSIREHAGQSVSCQSVGDRQSVSRLVHRSVREHAGLSVSRAFGRFSVKQSVSRTIGQSVCQCLREMMSQNRQMRGRVYDIW